MPLALRCELWTSARERLKKWVAGEEAPPSQVFLDALDVIADGPYASPDRRRLRVAVLQPAKSAG